MKDPDNISRRALLQQSGLGFGSLALTWLLNSQGALAGTHATGSQLGSGLRPTPGNFPARAKSVIQLVQNGGPSQMDLFDPKPELTRLAGKPHPDGVEIHQPNNTNILLPSQFGFRKYGQCGMDVSEALPHIAEIVDDL